MSQHHHNITPELYLHLHHSRAATKAHVQETVRDRYTKRCHYARGTHRGEPQKSGNSAGRKEGQLALMLGRYRGDGDVMKGCNIGIVDSKTALLRDSFGHTGFSCIIRFIVALQMGYVWKCSGRLLKKNNFHIIRVC